VPALVSQEDPRFDDWLPEVAIAPDGRAYVAWYAWREPNVGGCGIVSDVMLSASDDGGLTWSTLGRATSLASDWTLASSSLIPNQGDYIALAATGDAVHVAWADARSRDPDVFTVRIDATPRPTAPSLAAASVAIGVRGTRPNPSRGDVTFDCVLAPREPARLTVLDLAGRELRRMEVVAGEDGRASVRVPWGPDLPPGVYLARVEQQGRRGSARFAIVR
jgi:hypothetical protein